MARIMHSTTLYPMEYMKVSEGDDDPKSIECNVEEGWKAKANEEVAGPDKWTYANPFLMAVGRVVHDPKLADKGPDDAKDDFVAKQKEDFIERLKPLSEDTDKGGDEEPPKWTVTIEGPKDKFVLSPDDAQFNAVLGGP